MHSLRQSDWAEGLHLTVTGLNQDQRKQVRNVVEAAGGRYVVCNGCLTVLSHIAPLLYCALDAWHDCKFLHSTITNCGHDCRYSPNFSKRCTHLIVSAEQNDASQLKVYLASINRDKWHARAVRFEWLMECATHHRQVDEDAFEVQPPRHEVSDACMLLVMYACVHWKSTSMNYHRTSAQFNKDSRK